MGGYPVANLVGKLGAKFQELRNTYYITNSGLLIPDTTCFFFDSAAHPLGFVIGYADSSKLREIGPKKESLIDRVTILSENFKQCIDEILSIVDPKNSYGIVNTAHRGMYSKDSIGHFNSSTLRELFDKASRELFDLRTLKPLPALRELEAYWNSLIAHQNSYLEKLCEDTNCPDTRDPLPRDYKELGILLENLVA